LLEVLALEGAGAVDEPDIALRVRGEARHIADLPLRRHLGPILLHFESRQRPRRLSGGSGAEQILTRQGHRHAGRKQDCKTEVLTFHGLSSVGLQLEIAWELFLEWPRRATATGATSGLGCSAIGTAPTPPAWATLIGPPTAPCVKAAPERQL